MTGAYTEIVEIIVPSQAVSGETVNIEVRVKNLHTGPSNITVTGSVNGLTLHFGSVYHTVPAGSIQSFYDAFIMPDRSVRVYAWSWYWGDNDWQVVGEGDDEAYKDIVLPEEAELELLDVRINPVGAGYVTVTPTPISGVEHLWYFEYGTLVAVTAHPYTGYKFKSWSGEMTDTTAITAPVYPMTEKRTITAHFEEEALPVQTLEIDITPIGMGHVITDPASEEGKTEWHNDDTGTFPYGTKVKVTAIPIEGYQFEKWSDEIVGGVSYNNPSYVQDMTEHRAVKAHFREIGEEPIFLDFKIEAIDGQSVPLAEVIAKVEGETLKVVYSFKYKVISAITINIWASLYQVTRTELAQTKTTITLDEALDWKTYEGEIDIVIGAVSSGVLYGVICELPDYGVENKIEDCLEVSALPSIWDMLGPLLVIGLMAGMIMPMMKEVK